MTIEELRLRVALAFPSATVSVEDDDVWADFQDSALLKIAGGHLGTFRVRHGCRAGELSIYAPGRNWCMSDPEGEIERRILAVSAHGMIAECRRLAKETNDAP
jgi:hypothetical protein